MLDKKNFINAISLISLLYNFFFNPNDDKELNI